MRDIRYAGLAAAGLAVVACVTSGTLPSPPPAEAGSPDGSPPEAGSADVPVASEPDAATPTTDGAPSLDGAVDAQDGAVASDDAGDAGPTLTLTLSGFTLSPAFSPTVHDYAIRCAAGTNATTVSATAPDGVTVAMVQPQAVSLAQPVPVSLGESDAVVVESTAQDGTTTDYWVRCLPHDFPQLSLARYGKTTPGYYVTGNTSVAQGDAAYAMVLDGNATPLWYRAMGAGNVAGLVTVVDTDTIAYIAAAPGRFGTDPSAHFTVVSLDTGQETSFMTTLGATDEHEFLPLENGDFMMLSYPATSGIDMSSRGVTNTQTIADCSVEEIAPDGTLVWSWLGSDHFDVVTESTELGTGTIGGVAVIDPFHCNSIDVNADGDVLLSARQLDAVVLISRASGEVVWKLGGIPSNKDGAQILQMQSDPETSFYHQHDARFLPNGDISLYDDHTTQFDTQMPPPDVARGMEVALDVDPDGGTGTVVFQYQGTTSASATGSFRRYSDGSSVVGWGFLGTSAPALGMTELDNVGNPLLELSFVGGDHPYRALKVSTTSLAIDVLRRTAGMP